MYDIVSEICPIFCWDPVGTDEGDRGQILRKKLEELESELKVLELEKNFSEMYIKVIRCIITMRAL